MPGVVPTLDLQAFADYLVLSHPVGTHTFIQEVKLLAPGHIMTVSCDDFGIEIARQKAYYRPVSVRNADLELRGGDRGFK